MAGLAVYMAQLACVVFSAVVHLLFILIAIYPAYFLGGLPIFGDIFVMPGLFSTFGLLIGYLLTWLAAGDFVVINQWLKWSQNGLVFIIIGLSMSASHMIVHDSIFGSIYPGCLAGFLVTAIISHVMLYGDAEVVNNLLTKLSRHHWKVTVVFRCLRERNFSALHVPMTLTSICSTIECFRGSRLILQVKDYPTQTQCMISPAPDSTSSASPDLSDLAGPARLLFRVVVLLQFISFAISPTCFLGGLYFLGDISILLSIIIFGLITGNLLAWIAEGDFAVLNQWIAQNQHGLVFYIVIGLSMGASHLIVSQCTYIGYLVATSIIAIVLYLILYGDREVVYNVTTKLMWQNVQSTLSSFFQGCGAASSISLGLTIFCWAVQCLDASRLILHLHDSRDGPLPVISTASASHSTTSVSPDILVCYMTRVIFRVVVLLLFILVATYPTHFFGGLCIFGDISVMLSIFFGVFGLLIGYLVTWLAEGDFIPLNQWITWSRHGLVLIVVELSMGVSYMILHGSISLGGGVACLVTAIVSHVLLYGDREVVKNLMSRLMSQHLLLAYCRFREGNYFALCVLLGSTFIFGAVQRSGVSQLILQVEDLPTQSHLVVSPVPDSTSSASPGSGGPLVPLDTRQAREDPHGTKRSHRRDKRGST